MRVDAQVSLGNRLLVFVAHQDDEVTCSVLLQRTPEALIVFATDGLRLTNSFGHPTAHGDAMPRYGMPKH